MARMIVRLVVGAVSVLTLALLPRAAFAAADTFTASPTSGPPGTAITVSSVTPCTSPVVTPGGPLIVVTLDRGQTAVASVRQLVRPDGSWQVNLVVPALAAPGADTISAFCLSGPQAEGAIAAYTPVRFTVQAAPAAPALANTGTAVGPATAGAAGLILVGAGLVAVGRRRARAPGPHASR